MSPERRESNAFKGGHSVPIGNVLYASKLPRWAGWFLIILTGALMAYWSWGSWPDVLIDFGRELYIPWRLIEGDALYRDIAYFNGPLSPYVNFLWFSLFGVSIKTLVACNLFLLIGFTALLYRMLEDVSDQLAAVTSCIVFLLIFSFAQLVAVGNYNFITPYSHEATHGIMLAFLSLFFLWEYEETRSVIFILAAGLVLGLVSLTKIELILATVAADAVFLALIFCDHRFPRRQAAQHLGIVLGATLIPIAVAASLLSTYLPISEAIRATASAWAVVLNPAVTSQTFYLRGMGLNRPAASLVELSIWAMWYGAIFGPTIWIGLSQKLDVRRKSLLGAGWAFLVATAIVLRAGQIEWSSAFLPLPLVMLAASFFAMRTWFSRGDFDEEKKRIARSVSIIVLALVLLTKMILNVRVFHYGFFLAMPAVLLMITGLLSWLPRVLDARGGSPFAMQLTAGTVLILTVVIYLGFSSSHFSQKQYVVGWGSDQFRSDVRGSLTQNMLSRIVQRIEPGQSLAVLPEGVMLNYLARRATSIPYINFMPLELMLYGEDKILQALADQPPDFIAIVHKDTSEYGYRFFGADYGKEIMVWIRDNYGVIERVGGAPLRTGDFGIQLLARK